MDTIGPFVEASSDMEKAQEAIRIARELDEQMKINLEFQALANKFGLYFPSQPPPGCMR